MHQLDVVWAIISLSASSIRDIIIILSVSLYDRFNAIAAQASFLYESMSYNYESLANQCHVDGNSNAGVDEK